MKVSLARSSSGNPPATNPSRDLAFYRRPLRNLTLAHHRLSVNSETVDVTSRAHDAVNFEAELHRHGIAGLTRSVPRTLQANVGKVCNQACHHCHVDAGPARTEKMDLRTAARVIELLSHNESIATVDITGGAPELNQHFRYLVETARRLSREVIVRCNLTVILQPGMDWLPAFYREHRVHLICSLPCYTEAMSM